MPGSHFQTQYSFNIGIDRSGKFAYEVTGFENNLRSFAIGATGSLTEIPGSRIVRGTGVVWGVAATP